MTERLNYPLKGCSANGWLVVDRFRRMVGPSGARCHAVNACKLPCQGCARPWGPVGHVGHGVQWGRIRSFVGETDCCRGEAVLDAARAR